MEKTLRKENKIIRVQDEAEVQMLLNDGYVLVEATAESKQPDKPKIFEQMNAGEQITFIEALTDLAAVEALVGQTDKKTAVAAIEAKIEELKAGQ